MTLKNESDDWLSFYFTSKWTNVSNTILEQLTLPFKIDLIFNINWKIGFSFNWDAAHWKLINPSPADHRLKMLTS